MNSRGTRTIDNILRIYKNSDDKVIAIHCIEVGVLRRSPHRLMLLEQVSDATRLRLQEVFTAVLAPGGSVRLLPPDELVEVLKDEHPQDLLLGVAVDTERSQVLLYRGDLTVVAVPFDWFQVGPANPEPDFDQARIDDCGQTLALGEYEAAADAILYDFDDDFRRRAKKNQLELDDSLGGSIRRLRNARRLSRAEFAPVSAKEVARIERGEIATPRDSTLEAAPEKVVRTSREKPTLNEIRVHSHNWCDKTSWYTNSIRITGEVLATNDPERKNFDSHYKYWIDLNHGKVTDEDALFSTYCPEIFVDGVLQTEKTPFSEAIDGDYSVDYETGRVSFHEPIPEEAVVTADYSYATDSVFVIKPQPGKKLLIQDSEIEFTTDFDMKDTSVYEVFLYAAAAASLKEVDLATLQAYFTGLFGSLEAFHVYCGRSADHGDLQPTDKVPSGIKRRYKTYWDFKAHSNGNYPVLPAIGGHVRGTRAASITYPFDYKGTQALTSSSGAEIRMYLENHKPWGGGSTARSTIAFYCIEEDE